MKKEKKTYSLVTKEILNILIHLMYLVLGVSKLIDTQTAAGNRAEMIVLIVTLIVVAAAAGFRISNQFDIEDEAAKEHYDKSKRKVFDFIWGFICGAAVAMAFLSILMDAGVVPMELNFTVNAWWLMILYGIMQVAISLYFIYFEKREA